MAEVRFLPPAAKFIKKLTDKKLKALYQKAIDDICADHTVGEPKRGDLHKWSRDNFNLAPEVIADILSEVFLSGMLPLLS